jgi:arsenite methyltransferase
LRIDRRLDITTTIILAIARDGDKTMNDTAEEFQQSPIDEVRALYTELAVNPGRDFGWGKGKENARSLGYDGRWLDRLPASIWECAAAVGNPFSLGPIRSGETIVDLGCGAGADLCIAALLVGGRGQVVGIDITPAMVAKAQKAARDLGLTNVDVRLDDIAALPLENASTDVVISNGSINLSSHKPCVFKEVFRILRPDGRFQFADMVRDGGAADARSCGSWADCVSGTVETKRYLDMLAGAGFRDAQMIAFTGYRTAPTTIGATFRATRPLASV